MGRLAIKVGGWFGLSFLLTEPANTPIALSPGKREVRKLTKMALTGLKATGTFRLPLLQGGAAW
jgi:hypothetical protein